MNRERDNFILSVYELHKHPNKAGNERDSWTKKKLNDSLRFIGAGALGDASSKQNTYRRLERSLRRMDLIHKEDGDEFYRKQGLKHNDVVRDPLPACQICKREIDDMHDLTTTPNPPCEYKFNEPFVYCGCEDCLVVLKNQMVCGICYARSRGIYPNINIRIKLSDYLLRCRANQQ